MLAAPLSAYPAVGDTNFGMLPWVAAQAAAAVCAKAREADPAMVRTHLLSVMSSAVAPFYVIAPPDWSPVPISVSTLCIADVGGSKTPVHDLLARPLKQHNSDSFSRFEAAQLEADAAKAEHKFQVQLLKAEVSRALRKGEPTKELLATLSELNRAAPFEPKHRPRLAANLDLESMLRQLDGEYEAIDFITAEGDKFLTSSLMRHVSDLIDLIDGQPLEFRREKKKHLYAASPRGTFGLMAQPAAIAPFRPRCRRHEYVEHRAVTLGFFARFLICAARPSPLGNGYARTNETDAALTSFHQTVDELYCRHRDNQEAGGVEPIELHLAPDAVGYWEELVRITGNFKVGQWSHIPDFVSKMLNLTARVAGVLHVWESESHYISVSSLQRAWSLVQWHAGQYELVFVPPPPLPQQEADVAAVTNYLLHHRFSLDYKEVPTEPIGLLLEMPSNRLRAALLRMAQRDMIEPLVGRGAFIDCTKMFSRSRNITWR